MEAAGDLAEGIYFRRVGRRRHPGPGRHREPGRPVEAEIYQSKPLEYGLPESELRKGFATQGWSVMLTVWETASLLAVAGEEATPEALQPVRDRFSGIDLIAGTELRPGPS